MILSWRSPQNVGRTPSSAKDPLVRLFSRQTRPPRPAAYFLLSLLALAACRETPIPLSDAVPHISITCASETCTASPDHLAAWPQKLITVGSDSWDSRTIEDGSQALIELRSQDNRARMVRLPVIDQKRPGFLLPLIALGSCLLALLCAAGVAYLALDTAAAGSRQAMRLNGTLRDLDRSLQSIAESLDFRAPPEPRPAAAPEPVAIPRDVEALKSEIGQFLQYLKDCFVGIGRATDTIEHKVRELERLRTHLGRQSDAASARAQYRDLARTLARLALRATDDDRNKHGKPNPAAEAALGSLLGVVRYTLLAPKPLERYSDRLHISRGGTVPAESRNQRGCIARVERRGLVDADNEVIEKAEVVLYD